jgi:hypothetical protein
LPGPANSSRPAPRACCARAISATASKITTGGAVSADGAALQMFPPIVAMLRVCIEPTMPAPSASAV